MRKNRKELEKYTITVRLHFKHYQVTIMTSKSDHCARLFVLTQPQEYFFNGRKFNLTKFNVFLQNYKMEEGN